MGNSRSIKVAVAGACGKMGRMTCAFLHAAPGIEVVAVFDRSRSGESYASVVGPDVPDLSLQTKLGAGLDDSGAEVLVDFTHPGCAADHAVTAIKHGVAPIIGTSGLKANDLSEIQHQSEATNVAALVVPNFAVGAVLMIRMAEMAAKWMPDVEVIEMHHDQKADAPSGTAIATIDGIAHHRGRKSAGKTEIVSVEGARGGSYRDVQVHSVRLKGLLAHQEVMFGALGQVLTVRHDALDRSCYMPGVELAVRYMKEATGFAVGLDAVLFGKN
jgi:4-hydroxy-tetrahydrodipicolinate reductase